ncbi:hypothetical protein RhiirA4_484514 [Rhizophagus irregularis]|uniref:ZSWIM1/3 RNaseH-like domain-containing protein n=1 Tax=Rhizophagus irregularis TaxID=588596 RepID=A0A2I1HP21_9GLOM|nr:hypothetical protein RhiirA4_484514 [Rhizophagus irregularis]
MELNWDFFLNFSEDAIFPENFFKENNENTVLEDIITPPESPENFYIEINENTVLEDIITPPKSPNNFFVKTNENTVLEDIITPPEFSDNFFNEPPIELFFQSSICRNDKNPNNPSITIRKSYRCSFGGTYKSRKNINQKLQWERGSNKFNCQWHCNFTLQKLENWVKCITLEDIHNHELISTDIPHLNVRYRQFNNEMMQDLKFFTECKDVYNSIYRLCKNNEKENLDTTSFLNIFLEKIIEDPHWKIFVRHSGNKRRLSGIFWMSSSQHELYQQFHDVVLNDNTCKTNKYNMYLSVFMIKDNYGKFRNVANAFVEDEMASGAKAYTPFQFNAGIQSTQSVELFNVIIKKALNSASSFYDIEKVIDKKHEAEFQYCKLANLKVYQTTVRLPHLSSQFFSNIDVVLNQFLTPLVLSWQKF